MIKKEKLKKALSLFLALVLMLGIVMPTVSEVAEAKTYYVKHELMGETEVFGSTSWGNGCKVLIGKTNPQIGFCIQPGVSLANGNHSTITPSSIGLSQKKLDKLALIAYYGYRDKTHNNTNYCLTQSLIWKELGSSKRIGIGKYKSESAMKPWFDAVMKKVNRFNVKPSFNGKTYTVNAGKTKSIKDTKGVLSELKINRISGGKASISGDTLKVTPDGSSSTMKILFVRPISTSQTKTNFVLRSGKAQAVSPCLSGRDPYTADIYIKVNLNGKAQITKKSESGKYIKGAKFNIKNASGSVNKNATTDGNGKILFTDLKPGKYTVKEVSVPSPYLLDKTPKTVTVKANETAKVSFTNKLPRGNFNLQKTKENGKPLVGAKFKIWSVGNDPEGKKIGYSKTFTTDEKGKIAVTKLKLGTYKYQEIEAPSGYVLDSTVRSFKLTYKNSLTSVVTSAGTVKNKMPRGNFELIKSGTDGTKLTGAEYKIWSVGNDPEGTPINFNKTYKTDKNGSIKATDLKLGTYKYKEVKAPDGYVLDETVGEFKLSYKDQNTAVVGTSTKRVDKKIEASKLDVNGKLVAGAELKVVDKDNKVVDSWTSTGTVHKIKNLVEGQKYTLVEVKAPKGYIKAKSVDFTVTSEKKDQKISMTDMQTEIVKTDKDGKKLSGMSYEVVNSKGTVVDKGVTSVKERVFLNNLIEGEKYTITETKAPDGYVLNNKEVTFTAGEKGKVQLISIINKQIVAKKLDVNGNLIKGAKLEVINKDGKVIDSWTTDSSSHVIKNLKAGNVYKLVETEVPKGYVHANPVEFTIGDKFDTQEIEMVDQQVSLIKTDVDGTIVKGATFEIIDKESNKVVDTVSPMDKPVFISNLKEGKIYIVKEVKTPEGYVAAKDIEFTVSDKIKEIKALGVKDKQVDIKKLNIDEKIVEGAELKVVDKNNKVIDSWTVKDGNHKVKGLKEGETYTLIEDYAPDGYVLARPVKFEVSFDKENQSVKMIDKQVNFKKVDKDGKLIGGMEYIVTSNKTKKVVDKGVTNSKEAVYLNGLEIGEKYTITETKTPEGYVTAKPIEFTVTEDNKTQEVKMTDKKLLVEKNDVKGLPVIGAKLEIIDKDGKVIDSWIVKEGEKHHTAKGLIEGKTYTLVEKEVPKGYVLANPVKFTVTGDKETQIVKMIDQQVSIVKTDIDGNIVKGATFEIIDGETGKIVDTVSPMDKPVFISNLKEGKKYAVKEIKTPEGYVTARPVKFEVSDKIKEIKAVTVKDKQVNVFKENGKGELIEGAELKVVDKDGKVVDSWTTTNKAHNIKNLVEGEKYTLIEDYAPDGYVIARPVKFEVSFDKENQSVKMIDRQVEFIKTDLAGNKLSGMEYTVTHNKSKKIVDKGITNAKARNFLNGLEIGEKYTITETKTPKGYVTAKPIEFTVTGTNFTGDSKLQTVVMKDKQLSVKKTDIGGKNVVGAELKVVDKETGDVIDSWTVKEGEPKHIVEGLIEGKEYTLIEDYAPDGFTISNSIDFTVTEDKINQGITMIDKVVDVDKINIEGESLKGVKLQIVNKKTKQIVDEWITDGSPHKVSLVEGMEYTLIELESIDGYALAKPMDFTVTEDKETQHIVMIDKKVQFKKIGLNNKTLTGGKFEIKDKETGKVVDTVSAEKKYIDVNNLVEGKTYIIHEVEAPYGYEIGKDVEFTVTYDKKTQKLIMKDKPKEGRIILTDDNDYDEDDWDEVETGDRFGLVMLLILLIASVGGSIILGTDKKKKHR